MKKGKYYIGYSFENERIEYGDCMGIDTYEEALKEAKESHKDEISFRREERGEDDGCEIQSTYVVYVHPDDGNEYVMAKISGWRSKLEEWEFE